jgi:cytochrome c oxidase assembly factor CtaG
MDAVGSQKGGMHIGPALRTPPDGSGRDPDGCDGRARPRATAFPLRGGRVVGSSRWRRVAAPVAVVLALLARPREAWAHAGRAPEPHDLWTAWTFEPAVVAGLALACAIYARGVHALWRSAGRGRGIAPWRVACFGAGLLALVLALVSPIDAVATALFSVHMTQHMLLVVVAAPLILLGDPGTATLWALRIEERRRLGAWWGARRALPALWRVLRLPLVAFTLHVGTLWAWHVPSLYDAAIGNDWVHAAEHASFFLTALLFWYPIADPHPRRRYGVGVATLYLFAAGLQGTLLGALMSFARHPWYLAHYGTTAAWGLTPLEDQQLAGLVMWIPAGLVYLVALVPTVLPVLRSTDQLAAPASLIGASARGTP